MARKVLVRLVDDLDGSPSADVAPVTFALDGVTYQIDLNRRNADRLRESLAAFVASARRTSGRAKRGTAIRAGGGATGDVSTIREWAKEQGLPVSARGRIPANILDAYNSTNGAAAESAPRATRTRTAAVAKSAPTATAPAKRGRPASKPAASKAAPKTVPKAAPKAAQKTTRATKPAAATKSAATKSSGTKASTARTTRAAATKTTAKAATTRTARTPRATAAKAAKPAPVKATRGASAKTAKAATPAPRRAVARKARG
jgi:hypothetical protein